MITLQRPDPKVSAFLGLDKGVKHGDLVKPSQFALPSSFGPKRAIFNTLTKQCIESKYFEWFKSQEARTYDSDDIEMTALLKHDFLVAPNVNEADRYSRLVTMLRHLEEPEPGYVGYTILPTTACNARCFYCYERDIPFETMTDEIIEQTICYIRKTRRKESPLKLHWFGGEPLLGENVIDRICEAMRKDNVMFFSDMISNGSLMTSELAAKAKNKWNLNNVQITLDGRENVYCERKRYSNFNGSPYRAVLDGIHAMMANDIPVSIRLNVDENNLEDLMALADELEEEFKEDSKVSIYCHSIFAEQGENVGDCSFLYDGIDKLNDRLFTFNRNRVAQYKGEDELSQARIDDDNIEWQTDKDRCPNDSDSNIAAEKKHYDRRYALRRYNCMMDSPMSGGVIVPNGDIYMCEHFCSTPVVGSIFDEKPFQRDSFICRGREKDEKCSSCAFLPTCTDFMSCPNKNKDCIRELYAYKRGKLQSIEHENRLPPVTVFHEGKTIRITEPTPEFAERCTAILGEDYLEADEYITQAEAEERGIL